MALGIIGDDYGTTLPESNVDDLAVRAEAKMARFTKSEGWKDVKEHFEKRIEYYQTYLPDGRPVATTDIKPFDWALANAIIAEFNMVINGYEQAVKVVEGDKRA